MKSQRRGLIRAALALALAAASPARAEQVSAARAKEIYAEQITPENAAARRVGGSDAIGGLGDWALGNGTLCAVVSDPSHESILSPRGGVLIDLAHCGRDDDQWNVCLTPPRDLPLGLLRHHDAHRSIVGAQHR